MVLESLSSPDLEHAMNANQAAFWKTIWQHASDIKAMHHDSKIAWSSSDVDAGYIFNFVMPLHLEKSEMDETIAAAIDRTTKRKVRCEWWISPVSIENGLGERLESMGFAHAYDAPAMAVDLAKLNTEIPRPANLEVRHVEDEAGLSDWLNILLEGWPQYPAWGVPFQQSMSAYGLGADLDFRHFVGYMDGKPVTASSMLYSDGVAGIYAVATHRDFRGRGLGAHITLAPLLEAREEGYRIGILQASSKGHPVYIRLGFEDMFHYQVFRWPAPQPQA